MRTNMRMGGKFSKLIGQIFLDTGGGGGGWRAREANEQTTGHDKIYSLDTLAAIDVRRKTFCSKIKLKILSYGN